MEWGSQLHIQRAGLDAAEWPEYRIVRPRFLEPRYWGLPPSTDAGALREVGAVRSLIATLEGTRHDHATAWNYGEEALRNFRDYTHLRYRLLPYIYTYANIAAETSVPIMRPMLLEFPTDSCVHGTDLQYMFGSELLVAPIYNSQGQRPVYLPSGRWVDYWTREVIEGLRMLHVEATLDTLPL
jgi:Glycosyl hydrolases family 31